MSMFYELMMKNKTKIMYATIKGSLTENDDVFSGFSASNYLQLQQSLSNINNFEIQVKIRTAEGTTFYRCIFGSLETRELTLAQGSSSKLLLQLGNNGSSYAVELTGTTNLQPLTDYYIRVIYNNGTFSLLLSSDGINWNNEGSVTYTISTVTFIFGNGWNLGTYYWRGSIDLPNSYIKLGATKYNLQAVVGYTIVGSPTIIDEVLINPTDKQNTIQTAEALDVGNGSFEMQFCLLNPTVKGTPLFRIVGNNGSRCTFSATNTFNLYPNYQTDSSVVLRALGNFWSSAINNSAQKVYLRIKCTGKDSNNEYPFIFSASTDSMTWNTTTVISSLPLATGKITYCSSYASYQTGYVVGYDLDLKETWIKKDGKLWFNGQQA